MRVHNFSGQTFPVFSHSHGFGFGLVFFSYNEIDFPVFKFAFSAFCGLTKHH